jgi:Bifunctional DNA primase/polymerase, N-terminal
VTSEQTLDRLYRLLGDAVLLPIPLGKKRPQETEWQNLTFDQHKERHSDLLKAINRGGNIGVLLGPKSNRLFALDLDDDELIDKWLARFPWLADTLRTRGARGCQFFMRLENDCEYPNGKAVYLIDANGHETRPESAIGELRLGGSGGAQSVIFGVHPAGMDYKIVVDKPPRVISLAELNKLTPVILSGRESQESAPARAASNVTAALPLNIRERLERYLDRCEPAVSGQRGHDTTFRVLCAVINGFDLGPEEAWAAAQYYNRKCEPVWPQRDLEHKVKDALKAHHEKPRGHLLQEDEFGAVRPPEMPDKKLERELAQAGRTANGAHADSQAEPQLAPEAELQGIMVWQRIRVVAGALTGLTSNSGQLFTKKKTLSSSSRTWISFSHMIRPLVSLRKNPLIQFAKS